ncbi:MAG: UpxY family transcription antiterminator [Muribaculum sp.]|nr:UpxY family transcription antiterminator [Muribaculum sp.]
MKGIQEIAPPVPQYTDDAVGVPDAKWYVAIVNNRSEKKNAKKLTAFGIENYVPIQKDKRLWSNGRHATVDRVVIPTVIFIRCTEQQRREIVKLPFIFRFMTNRTGASTKSDSKPIAIVSNREIETLKFMLEQSDTPVFICDAPYKKGELVKVIRGSLAGLVGEVARSAGKQKELAIRLDTLGCALLTIDSSFLERIIQ